MRHPVRGPRVRRRALRAHRDADFAGADEYYERTKEFWDQVRDRWSKVFADRGTVTLNGPVDKLGLFQPLFRAGRRDRRAGRRGVEEESGSHRVGAERDGGALNAGQHASVGARLLEHSLPPVHLRLIRAAGQHVEHAFDLLQARGDQCAVAVVELAAMGRALRRNRRSAAAAYSRDRTSAAVFPVRARRWERSSSGTANGARPRRATVRRRTAWRASPARSRPSTSLASSSSCSPMSSVSSWVSAFNSSASSFCRCSRQTPGSTSLLLRLQQFLFHAQQLVGDALRRDS